MMTLDNYIQENNIVKLDFIKCDIEGAEFMALKGGSISLLKFRPMLLLEINSDWTKAFNYTPNEILRYLHEIGYNSFTIADQNCKRHDIERACNLDFSKGGLTYFVLGNNSMIKKIVSINMALKNPKFVIPTLFALPILSCFLAIQNIPMVSIRIMD